MHFDSRRDRSLDRNRRIGVGGDVSAPVLGSLDGGPQLGFGEGGYIEGAEWRRNAAARRQLDLRGPLHQLLARAHANLIRTVRDHAAANFFHAAEHAADRSRQIGKLPEVAMATGDRDYGTGRVDARAGDEILIDSPLEPKGRSAHVANGREAPHERAGRFRSREKVGVADVVSQGSRRRGAHQHRMPMRVDQPRHQHARAPIDHLSVSGDRCSRNLLDPVVADQNIGRREERAVFSVKNADVLEQYCGTLLSLRGWPSCQAHDN